MVQHKTQTGQSSLTLTAHCYRLRQVVQCHSSDIHERCRLALRKAAQVSGQGTYTEMWDMPPSYSEEYAAEPINCDLTVLTALTLPQGQPSGLLTRGWFQGLLATMHEAQR